MINVLICFGTRPEIIKLLPLIKKMQQHDAFNLQICNTGQHTDLVDTVLETFEITPDYNLQVMRENQPLTTLTSSILNSVSKIINSNQLDLVIVHGDTTTAYASALAAFYNKVSIAHVEAGLRTYDIYSPYPEEFNRQAIGIMARYHFAPTKKNMQNIQLNQNSKVFITGNTVIDTLAFTVSDHFSSPLLDELKNERIVLITLHRRENYGSILNETLKTIKELAEFYQDLTFVFPVHPNPNVKNKVNEILIGISNIFLIEPLDVIEFHNLMSKSFVIITDSGGIQEEAPSLNVPVLVIRNTTERTEALENGNIILTGTNSQNIKKSFEEIINNVEHRNRIISRNNPYGDGKASDRIIKVIVEEYT